jgi:hypothetical protein
VKIDLGDGRKADGTVTRSDDCRLDLTRRFKHSVLDPLHSGSAGRAGGAKQRHHRRNKPATIALKGTPPGMSRQVCMVNQSIRD